MTCTFVVLSAKKVVFLISVFSQGISECVLTTTRNKKTRTIKSVYMKNGVIPHTTTPSYLQNGQYQYHSHSQERREETEMG